jgi:hypothetical protein
MTMTGRASQPSSTDLRWVVDQRASLSMSVSSGKVGGDRGRL